MRDFEEIIIPFLAVGGVIGLIVVVITCLMAWECTSYQEMTGKQTRLSGGSCYIKDGQEWYRWDEYKYRFATKGERK